jgi:hypothetical protein
MNSLGQSNNKQQKQQQGNINPFASALVESEKKSSSTSSSQNDKQENNIANLLNNGQFSDFDQEFLEKERARYFQEQEAKRKKEALRKKLHDQINPVETYSLFRAKEENNKKELEQVREELRLLMEEIKGLNSDIDMAVSQNVASPGTEDAAYYSNFFHQLRSLIILLRQKVKSARSWAQQASSKSRKKRGLDMSTGKGVHASMNSERNFGGNSAG